MSKKLGLFLASAGVIVIPVVTVIIVMQMRSSSHSPPGGISEEGYRGMPNGLLIKDEVVGTGDEVQSGKMLKINYTGKFMNGKEFDSNHNKDKPFEMQLGSGAVIKGWDDGLVGMRAGGKRLLIIPPDLAYGKNGSGAIPPNSKLYFEIELLKVE